MTKEEAVKEIEKEEKWLLIAGYSAKNVDIAFDKIKSLISQLLKEPCEDTISRSDMLDAIGHGTTYTSEGLQKIIKGMPPVNPQPCEDAISRQVVLDIVDSYSESQSNVEDVTQDIISDIVALPPVNPQPKTGHWIDDTKYGGTECSECGKWYPHATIAKSEIKYCSECGVKMEEPE